MKKILLFGICLTTLVLMIVPTIPAQEYSQVKAVYEQSIQEKIDSILNSIEQFEGSNDIQLSQKEYLLNTFASLKEKIELDDPTVEPAFIKFILSTILSLIFALLGTIFGNIFGPLLAFIVQILTAPAILLAKIIELIFGESTNSIV